MKPLAFELSVTVITAGLLLVLTNYGNWWMPMPVHLLIIGVVSVLFFTAGTVVLKTISSDEREQLHRLQASQLAYLVGQAALITAIVIQSMSHQVDSWLVITVLLMMVTRSLVLIRNYYRN